MSARELRFAREVAEPAAARRFITDVLGAAGADVVDAACLLVSELVSNSVLHARTAGLVRASVDGGVLHVEVHDGSATPPIRKHYTQDAATGRGVMLVQTLADTWGFELTDAGKYVWFTLALVRPASRAGDLFDAAVAAGAAAGADAAASGMAAVEVLAMFDDGGSGDITGLGLLVLR